MKSYTGFTLIEVLISLLLISFILLGLDAAEIYALQQSRDAYYFSVATNQLNNMSERLYALHETTDITSQLTAWNAENATSLPQGIGTVTGNFPHYILTIYWGDSAQKTCEKIHLGKSGCLSIPLNVA